MTTTQATIRLHADGAIRVEPFIRLTGSAAAWAWTSPRPCACST